MMRSTVVNKKVTSFRLLSAGSGLSIVIKLGVITFGLSALIVNLSIGSSASASFAAAGSIVVAMYLLAHSRRNWLLFVVYGYFLICVYSSCIVNYFDIHLISDYVQWKGTAVSVASANILLLFLLCITVAMPVHIAPFPSEKTLIPPERKNVIVSVSCAVVVLVCGFSGVGESYTSLGRSHITPIYEYSIIFYIIGLFFSGRDKRILTLFGVVLFVRIVLDFSIGARVTSLEMISIWFLMVYSHRAKLARVLPVALVLFIVLLSVGEVRGSAVNVDAVFSGIRDYLTTGFSWDGAYAAYHTSESFVAYKELMGDTLGLSDFATYLASLLLGDLTGTGGLAYEIKTVYWNMGGGYFPFFFYYYGDYISMLVFSLFLGVTLRAIAKLPESHNARHPLVVVGAIWISATVFRWFSYAPTPLVRGIVLLAVIFLVSAAFAYRRKRQENEAVLG